MPGLGLSGVPDPTHPSLTGGDDVDIRIMLARFEAKLDVALAQHGAKLEQHGQEISELRTRVGKMEDLPRATPEAILDHESRLRNVEKTPTVSPKQLGGVVLGVLAALGAVAPFLDRLYS